MSQGESRETHWAPAQGPLAAPLELVRGRRNLLPNQTVDLGRLEGPQSFSVGWLPVSCIDELAISATANHFAVIVKVFTSVTSQSESRQPKRDPLMSQRAGNSNGR